MLPLTLGKLEEVKANEVYSQGALEASLQWKFYRKERNAIEQSGKSRHTAASPTRDSYSQGW